MKAYTLKTIFLLTVLFAFTAFQLKQQNPWKDSQLIEPRDLMAAIKGPATSKPVIFNIGFVNDIPGAINIGAVNEPDNLAKFDKQLKDLKKDTPIVIYCGCCPFKDCPNVRPAFKYLTNQGFKNHRLLNLPQNLKADWINKGYPLKD